MHFRLIARAGIAIVPVALIAALAASPAAASPEEARPFAATSSKISVAIMAPSKVKVVRSNARACALWYPTAGGILDDLNYIIHGGTATGALKREVRGYAKKTRAAAKIAKSAGLRGGLVDAAAAMDDWADDMRRLSGSPLLDSLEAPVSTCVNYGY